MAKVNKNKNSKIIYIIGGAILVIIIAINLILNNLQKNNENDNSQQEESEQQIEDAENEEIIEKLKNMEERDRMEFYFGMFLDYVENEQYDKAYDLLYSEFKKNYFPTLESFTEYAQKTFSEFANIKHENIERNGDVYVLWIYISDVLNDKQNEKGKEMNIVIQENDYNDFVMSFSVI